MNLRSRSYFLQSCLLAVTLGLGAYQPAAAAGFHNIAGTACASFNNAQADALERSHVRIYNPPSNYRALWVVCPMQRVRDDVYQTIAPGLRPTFYITAFFAAEVPAGTSVTCVFREFDNRTVHEPGDGVPDPYLINSQAMTLTKLGNEAQVRVSGQVFNVELPDPGPGSEEKHYWTFTCLLPPGTGINEIDVEQL